MARPRFVPTEQQRSTVKSMAAYSIRQEEIARVIDLRSVKTLRRHFRRELDISATEANARVAQTAYQMATSGKHPQVTIFWLKSRAHWGDQSATTQQAARAPSCSDLGEWERLGMLHCSDQELAAWFRITAAVLQQWRQRPSVREALERGRAIGKIRVRSAQMEQMEKGNSTMAKWLGEQFLGQGDHVESTDQPIPVVVLPSVED